MPKENPTLREVILERERQAKEGDKGPRPDFSPLEGMLLQAIKEGFSDEALAFVLANFITATEIATRLKTNHENGGTFNHNGRVFIVLVTVLPPTGSSDGFL